MIAPLVLAAAQAMTFTADRIAADAVTRALTATGRVEAVAGAVKVRGEYMTRDADGTMTFHDPTWATTCTNAVGHTHWNVSGELEYKDHDHVLLRNAWLRFYEIPVLWLPYLYYPLDRHSGFEWMPGYASRWGAYLLTRCSYDLLGDPAHGADTYWLKGATRFDLRYKQGVAFGEELSWNLGDFGRGGFDIYYAWDLDVESYDGKYASSRHSPNWESSIDRNRYSIDFRHRLEPTERDTVRLRASILSDSSFRNDFVRKTLLGWKGPLVGHRNSGVFWEHVENQVAFGAEASGRLNDFYEMADRLPEIYFDVNPVPVLGSFVNYESENRIGYLRRNPAELGDKDPTRAFSFYPGRWAEYDAFRFDTYHRLTAPFRTLGDVLSVVPRIGYRATYWSETGKDNLTGWGKSSDDGDSFRSILEGGVTFAGRGTGLVDDKWRHTVEPYLDVLAQKAWLSGSGRPYVFDSLDASVMWEDQFAGCARNLPYTYYGVTPGMRNAWEKADEKGNFRDVVDFDVYAAVQFNTTDFIGADGAHKLAEVGDPNYGKHAGFVSPGARIRWAPNRDLSLFTRAEYDSDNNCLAVADAGLRHKVTDSFKYNVSYALRDFRRWDFSSAPYAPDQMKSDDLNYAKMQFVNVGFEHQPLDWLAWGPFVRWDIRENELDSVGTWIDYLTDCLGFRLIVEYENSYYRIDGYEHGDDWSVGFYIYLRAFSEDSHNFFSGSR